VKCDAGRLRLAVLFAALTLIGTACSSGPVAPALGFAEEVCIPDFCVGYPSDWEVVELGELFVSFAHPAGPDVVATVGRVNLEGVVVNAGGLWPQSARNVVDQLWSLLDGGDAELDDVSLVSDGSYDSSGFIGSGRLWHRLVPVTATQGYGVEVRAPNATWEPHAEVFRQNLIVLNSEL